MTVLPSPPKNILDEINKCIFNFIWDNKPDKIKRKILINDYKDGGLKVPNIYMLNKSIKASWVKRLLDERNNHQYKAFYNGALNKFGGKLVFESNIDEELINRIANSYNFLKDILISWSELSK